jgi:hypothetical protein
MSQMARIYSEDTETLSRSGVQAIQPANVNAHWADVFVGPFWRNTEGVNRCRTRVQRSRFVCELVKSGTVLAGHGRIVLLMTDLRVAQPVVTCGGKTLAGDRVSVDRIDGHACRNL